MVERSLCMREARGSIPRISTIFFIFIFFYFLSVSLLPGGRPHWSSSAECHPPTHFPPLHSTLAVSFPPPAVRRANRVNPRRTRWRRRRSSPPRAATSTPPPPPPLAPTRPRAHAAPAPAPAASAPRPASAAPTPTASSSRRTTPTPAPIRSSTPRPLPPPPHLRRRGLLLAPAAGMCFPSGAEGVSRSRAGDAAAPPGERGRCPSRRSGGTPPLCRRRTVLALSVGGGLRGRGRCPTTRARTGALRSVPASHFTPKFCLQKSSPLFTSTVCKIFFVFLSAMIS